MTAALVAGLGLLLFFGLPLYIALFGISAALFSSAENMSLWSTTISFQKLQSQEFLAAIPLFTFAGYLMSRGQSPVRVVNLFRAAFSFLRGADAGIVVAIMALFTALGGASPVAIIALGGLMLPLLVGSGKTEKFSLGLITSSGSIGLLFAPSLPVIIYAIIASQNQMNVEISMLFRAALLPSLVLIAVIVLFATLQKNRPDARPHEPFSWRRLGKAMAGARWEIPIPLIVYGGIYSGFVTVLEAAAITATYVFLMEFVLYRELSVRRDFVSITVESMKLSGSIFIIMGTALVLSNYLIREEIPLKMFQFMQPIIKSPYGFLLVVNLLLIVAGSLLEIYSAILIMLPILLPIVAEYGINPYHFAIVFLVNMEIGYLAPPVGINLFISSFRFKKPITMIYGATWPFLVLMFAVLLLLTYVPVISTAGLPKKLKEVILVGGPVGRPPPHQAHPAVPSTNTAEIGAKPVLAVAGERVDFIKIQGVQATSATLVFTAPGLSGGREKPARYEVRYLDMDLSSAEAFNDAEQKSFPATAAVGAAESIALQNLEPGRTWWLSIRGLDGKGHAGPWSPIVKFNTP